MARLFPRIMAVRKRGSWKGIKLFDVMNFIIEDIIVRPKEIEALYDKIPETKKEQIERRDKNKNE